MKKSITAVSILLLLTLNGFGQKDFYKNITDEKSEKIPNKSYLNSTMPNGQNKLETIEILANSSGPITPQFIYKGDVDPEAGELLVDPVAFEALINGSSMSSISPDDNGQFYISQGGGVNLFRMISWIDYAHTPMYELRFESDAAGLALDAFETGSIYRVPFSVWDLNGTPLNQSDDIQMLPLTNNLVLGDTTWGIRTGKPSSWPDNPANESDWIYMCYFLDGVTYADFESAYQQQVNTGVVDPDLWDNFLEYHVIRRITINSLDTNPLSTINSLNGLPRPAPGTIIRWTISINLFFNVENLYAAVGEPFNYILNVNGWPIPSVSTIQLPSWLTLGVSGDLYGTPGIADSGWNYIGLQATNSQGTVEGWYDMWVDKIPWNWWDHNNNNIVTSVFNVGKMGIKTLEEGSGFQFNGPNGFQNGLYDGELIIALSDSQSSGGLFSDRSNHDFATKSMVTNIYQPIADFEWAFRTEYDDSRNVSPLGVKVIQQSYTKSTAPDDDYVILDYEIYNENPIALNGMYVALFTDWDVGDANVNLGGYDATRKLNYIYEENGVNNPNYYGTALLSGDVSGNAFHADYDDSVRFYQMFSFEPPPVQAEDQFTMIASGPYNIAPNEAIRVVFAVLGGTDLADIQANVDAAMNVNLFRRPAQIAPQDGSTGISINPTLTWSSVYGATEYRVQLATDINFTNIIRDNTGTFTSFSYSGLDPETTYFWRVRAIYVSDSSDWSFAYSFTTFSYPQTIDLVAPPILFPTHNDISNYVPQDYRIVGMPGRIDSDMNLDGILGGAHKADWQVYRDNGTESQNPDDYLVEFDGSDEFEFGNGRAFWIINKGDLNISKTGVETANLNSNGEAEIQLHSGWNLITNPFHVPLPWWQVQQSNTIGPIYSFNGGWNDSDNDFSDFQPYMGYYVDSPSNMILKIPYGATLSKPSSLKNNIWQLDIVLSMNAINKSSCRLGVSEQADYKRDNLDYRKPRAVGSIPSVYFYRPEWDEGYGIFATDIRPEIQDVEKWDFTVSGSLNQKTTISFSEIEDVPEKHEIYLLDEMRSVYVNLRDQSEYSFIPVTEISNFYILVGNPESIESELNTILPAEFSLGENFPNPFNPSTIIPVSIPEESGLTLKVYDILGQEIRTIFNGTKEAGKHYFGWDGTNYLNKQVAAGIYLYRLNTNQGHTFVGKMVLVK